MKRMGWLKGVTLSELRSTVEILPSSSNPREGPASAFAEVGEHLVCRCQLVPDLIVDERQFPPETEVSLVVVADVGCSRLGPGPFGQPDPSRLQSVEATRNCRAFSR